MARTSNLMPVSDRMAREARLATPTALTRAVWDDCVSWTDLDQARTGAVQDEDGRLWDVLWMASRALAGPGSGDAGAAFDVWRISRTAKVGDDGDIEPAPVRLFARRSSEGVTISRPDEI